MKTIKQIILTILLGASCTAATAQNLSTMPAAKRDSFLIATSKEVVLKFGPDYYREYKEPIISTKRSDAKEDRGRVYYIVTFLYDKTEEQLAWDHAAKVNIWADNGEVVRVTFGNGYGRIITEANRDWRNNNTITPVPYQEATRPIYKLNPHNMSIIEGDGPINKDELIRKGWVQKAEGEWVRTRPDRPPKRWQRENKR